MAESDGNGAGGGGGVCRGWWGLPRSVEGQNLLSVRWTNSLAVQWLGLHASPARVTGLIPGWGTMLTQAKRRKVDGTSWVGHPAN